MPRMDPAVDAPTFKRKSTAPNSRNRMPDGTYKAGSKNGPKHRGEDGFWYRGHWFTMHTPFIPFEDRSLPLTVADEDYDWHRRGCNCRPCRTPEGQAQKERKLQQLRERLTPKQA